MELLERQAQVDELSRSLRESANVAGKVVLVGGEAGAGKSALIEHFASQLDGVRVLWGHCDALQTSRVLGPVNEIVADLFPAENAKANPIASREDLFPWLLERLSPPNPHCVVILEDLHWADEATLDFLRFIGRRIQRSRCLLIATYRDDELAQDHPLRGVLGDLTGRHATRLQLLPLSLAAVEQLAEGSQRNGCHVHGVTGGNPFFVRELLSAPAGTVPETVRDAVLARLLQCSPAARELAELLSLMPGRTDTWVVRSVLGECGAAADEAAMRGLLRHHEHALAFRHELGRLAVESTIAPTRSRDMHRAILGALIGHGSDVSQLVHHSLRAQDFEALLRYAPQAARQAADAGAHREAVAHLATALRYAERLDDTAHARLLEFHAAECDTTNQVSASIDSATQALALWRRMGDHRAQGRMLLLLSRQYWKSGLKEQADCHVADAIALLEGLPAGRDLAMAYSVRSQRAMTCGLTGEAIDFGQRALDLGNRLDDHGVRAHALNNLGTARLQSGDSAGRALLEESLAIALRGNLQEHAGRAYANLASIGVRHYEAGLAQRCLSEGLEYCEMHEVHDCLSYIRTFGAQYELTRGQWEKAARVASEALEWQTLATQRIPALTVLALVRARRGDPGVDALLDDAHKLAMPTGELQRIGPVAAARAELAWYRGDMAAVARHAGNGLHAAEGKDFKWIQGELHFWKHLVDAGASVPPDLGGPYALMISGDWQGAADAWERLGAPYERALALADGPEAALREALAILEQLGTGPLAAIVRQRLRDLGVRSIPRGPRASTKGHPAGLTRREAQVLRLLVRGHTNNELARCLHISAKTVDHHVSSILGKLEVRSRTEAVAAAFGLGILKATG
jgi:DNA-binding CsgD family transcriptional regulator/tetratricopeptide (TPR) repeat protein